ncbi:unnamed protein product [Lepeophtheirus salmonis]|uniref:(salmon louse) hypothetical protein n=1 Tax=Lepeophtheirus salmonis TaxID=72036 RepID=A0A7R8GZH5_LEPSM|nr:unnamed protein product [Lepeophtheirus salmonis]CAF2766203.1 unnamed protein product [Lepeophtheirus salmonis]
MNLQHRDYHFMKKNPIGQTKYVSSTVLYRNIIYHPGSTQESRTNFKNTPFIIFTRICIEKKNQILMTAFLSVAIYARVFAFLDQQGIPGQPYPPPPYAVKDQPMGDGQYPPQQPGYPPQGYPAYPPQQGGGYPPPPQQAYPPQQDGGYYPPQQPGYPPQEGGGYYPPQQQPGYSPQNFNQAQQNQQEDSKSHGCCEICCCCLAGYCMCKMISDLFCCLCDILGD